MRLTLRTLLAYLDDILEPGDAETLGEKIKENANADELTHRIRDSMSQRWLSCPPVHGQGMAADANTVSEYLDNTLAVERMPEFERTCLESNVHLSEVASCHQILTMVLGEPAEVDRGIRERAYGLATGSESERYIELETKGYKAQRINEALAIAESAARANASVPAVPEAAVANAPTNAPTASSTTSVSPANIATAAPVTSKSYAWPVALLLIAGFLVTAAILSSSNWMRSQTQVANGGGDSLPPISDTLHAPSAAGGNPNIDTPEIAVPTPRTAELLASPQGSTGQPGPNDGGVAGPVPSPVDAAGRSSVGSAGATDHAPSVAPPPLLPSQPDIAATEPTNTAPTPEELADHRAANAIGMSLDTPGIPEVRNSNPISPKLVEEIESETGEAAAEAPRDVARSVVDNQVLALWDADQQAWQRLPLRAPLQVGQRFRNLPTFRPQLLLIGGLQMTLVGDTGFTMADPTGVDTPRISLAFGQSLFQGMGQAPSRVELEVAGRIVTVQQGDPSSDFAVEVVRTRTPGSDPATAPRHHILKIWPMSGRIGITIGEESTQAVSAGQMWVAVDQRAAVIGDAGDSPPWANGSQLRDIDHKARLELEPMLTQERSLTLSLLEAAQHRVTDVRSLAARCLAALDRYEPIIESLGDRKQHAHWPQHVDQLRTAIDRQAESNALVTQALRRVTGPDADTLLAMLASYNPSQLANGGAEHLTDELEDESLEVRVIAIETLKKITGMSQLYRADRPTAQRQTAVQKWRGRLEDEKILYAEEPLIFSGDEE